MHNYKDISIKKKKQLRENCHLIRDHLFISCQYQDEIDTLNQVARHRPRSSLVLGIQQENRQIRQLQLENKGRNLSSVVPVISVNEGTFVLFHFFNYRAEVVIRRTPICIRAHHDQIQGAGFQTPHGQQKGRPCHCEPAQGAAHHGQQNPEFFSPFVCLESGTLCSFIYMYYFVFIGNASTHRQDQ